MSSTSIQTSFALWCISAFEIRDGCPQRDGHHYAVHSSSLEKLSQPLRLQTTLNLKIILHYLLQELSLTPRLVRVLLSAPQESCTSSLYLLVCLLLVTHLLPLGSLPPEYWVHSGCLVIISRMNGSAKRCTVLRSVCQAPPWIFRKRMSCGVGDTLVA